MAALSIMTAPGRERTVRTRSPSCWFFAHTASDQTPLIRSFRPAARAAMANVAVMGERPG